MRRDGRALGGEVASRMAVDVISRIYYEEADGAHPALANAFQEANREIYEAVAKGSEPEGHGNDRDGAGPAETATRLRLTWATAEYTWFATSEIYAMTQDHSEVMEMVRRGLIALEQARHHPDKNVILRAMGATPKVEVSTWEAPFPLREKDCVSIMLRWTIRPC